MTKCRKCKCRKWNFLPLHSNINRVQSLIALSVHLPTHPDIWLLHLPTHSPIWLSIHTTISHSLIHTHPHTHPSLHLPINPSILPLTHLAIPPSATHLPIIHFIYLSIHPSIHLSNHPFIHPPIHPYIIISIYLSIYSPTHPSTNSIIYSFIHPLTHPFYPFIHLSLYLPSIFTHSLNHSPLTQPSSILSYFCPFKTSTIPPFTWH